MKRRNKTLGKAVFVFMVAVVFAASGAAWAKKPLSTNLINTAPVSITACGTFGANNTLYLVSSFTTAATGDCIVISGDNDLVYFQPSNGGPGLITGPGVATSTGAGLHVTGDHATIEGNDAFITGFKVGVLSDGDTTVGDDIGVGTFTAAAVGNGTGLELTKDHNRWTNVTSSQNTGAGIWINSANHALVADFFSASNGGDGVLITNSDSPAVNVFISVDNGANGVHLGCASTGPGSAPVACKNNNSATVADAFLSAPNGVDNNTSVGVLLDLSELNAGDHVTLIQSSGNTTTDMEDKSTTCSTNLWFGNSFTNSIVHGGANPGCIQ